jgi:serine phosphatase RsbU (regulator of sigma subunit)
MNFWINKTQSKVFRISPNILFLAIFLFTTTPFFAQKAVKLNHQNPNKIELTDNNFWFWEAKLSKENDLTAAINAHSKFQNLPNLYPNFGFVMHDVWFRFVLTNQTSDKIQTMLSVSNPNMDEIDLYQKSTTAKWKNIAQLGDNRPYENKKIANRNFILPIYLLPRATDTFLLRTNNGGEQFHFMPALVTNQFFLQDDANTQLFFGIYFGIIAFIIIFNLFSYFALKDKNALWYASYVFSFGMLQVSLLGIGSYYFWSGNYLDDRTNPFFASTSLLFLLYFCMGYLKTKINLPKTHRLFRLFLFFAYVFAISSLIPGETFYRISVLGINGVTLILNILIIPIAYIAIREKIQEAKLFLIAFTMLAVTVFGFILKNFGLAPSNFLTDFGLQIGSSMEAILLSIGIVLKYKTTRETALKSLRELNELTEQANVVLEQKVTERTQEVESQKSLLEYKNGEILSSINYAKRIQDSLLPSKSTFLKALPNSALWYAPKDIVAGDFYWVQQLEISNQKWTFFAVGDCTGHGVPGAMMSVLCFNALESGLKEINEPNPGILLEKAAIYLNKSLQNENQDLADGMDISVACINFETKQMFWAGANNPLWILRNGEVIQYTATKRPVGKTDVKTPFESHEIELVPKDTLFLFSDGYVDQFGGEQNKKFKRNNFIQLIQKHSKLPIHGLMNQIKQTHLDWKGNEEQVDDICVMMVKID